MKLCMIIGIFVGCGVLGIWLDEDQKKRIKEIETWIYLFELLKAEIDYHVTPLKEATRSVAQYGTMPLKSLFEDFSLLLEKKEMQNVCQMWHSVLVTYKKKLHLREEDYEILESFGSACGYLDKTMQIKNIEMLIRQLNNELVCSKEKYGRSSKLNRSLGFLIGTGISIFFL